MWVTGVGVQNLGWRPANGRSSTAGQRRNDLVGVWPQRLRVLERSARGTQRHPAPARQEVKMQMEDLLSARRFVELHDRETLRRHAGLDGERQLVQCGHEAREVLRVDVE